jgi:hypothetical protein
MSIDLIINHNPKYDYLNHIHPFGYELKSYYNGPERYLLSLIIYLYSDSKRLNIFRRIITPIIFKLLDMFLPPKAPILLKSYIVSLFISSTAHSSTELYTARNILLNISNIDFYRTHNILNYIPPEFTQEQIIELLDLYDEEILKILINIPNETINFLQQNNQGDIIRLKIINEYKRLYRIRIIERQELLRISMRNSVINEDIAILTQTFL